mgnify:CR=1 FL=1
MILATQVREGMIIRVNQDLYRVTWMMHRTPGKGDACIQTKLKHVITGKNLDSRFRSSDKVDKVAIKLVPMQFLYASDGQFYFMDEASFDQHATDSIGQTEAAYLIEGESYQVQVVDDSDLIIGIEWPKTLVFAVTEAPPEIKRATATSSLRPVTLSNGLSVNAPGFIKPGDSIRINTADASYIERV